MLIHVSTSAKPTAMLFNRLPASSLLSLRWTSLPTRI